MNTSFERTQNGKDGWLTPKYIIDALGIFDLDPCSPIHKLWPTAKNIIPLRPTGCPRAGKAGCL